MKIVPPTNTYKFVQRKDIQGPRNLHLAILLGSSQQWLFHLVHLPQFLKVLSNFCFLYNENTLIPNNKALNNKNINILLLCRCDYMKLKVKDNTHKKIKDKTTFLCIIVHQIFSKLDKYNLKLWIVFRTIEVVLILIIVIIWLGLLSLDLMLTFYYLCLPFNTD